MNITEKDIKSLTPEHRVVWKEPGAPREVEMGLWVDDGGHLLTDTGLVMRWEDGSANASVRSRIVRIIEPPFVPRVGMFIGKPDSFGRLLVCVKDRNWLGYAPEVRKDEHWFSDTEARDLIENHGWQVMGDLTKGESDD